MDKRTVIAFVLIGVMTFIWITRLQRRNAPRPAAVPPVAASGEGASAAPASSAAPAASEARQASALSAAGDQLVEEKEYRLAGPDLEQEIVFTNRGAGIRSARLTRYPEKQDGETGALLLEELPTGQPAPATLSLRDPNGEIPFDSARYVAEQKDDGRLVFTQTFDKDLVVVKEFIPRPGKPEIGVRITFTNAGAERSRFARYEILAASRARPEGDADTFLSGACGILKSNGNVKVEFGLPRTRVFWPFGNDYAMPYDRQSNSEGRLLWAGAGNRYFAAVLRADKASDVERQDLFYRVHMRLLKKSEVSVSRRGSVTERDNVYVSVEPQARELAPGESVTHEYTFFMGPKTADTLNQYADMIGILDYGTFGIVSKLLLIILKVFHSLCGNFGVSIILLTILVKVCLHPLARKSQIAMHKMQKLQPLIREIQEKFKGDRQKQAQAQMELLRKHSANPMGGCWPMFLQIPVFFGLFRMLQMSVELRQAAFLPWWVTDLSQPDTIGHLGGFPVNILPVLMVISWVAQQMTQPKPADPQQAQTQKMMLFMPVVFGFVCYSMASGLTLYWLISTFLGILEQKWIKHRIAVMETEGAFAAEEAEVDSADEAKALKNRFRRK